MVYNIIPFLIIIASIAVILYIIGRKFPELRILDVSTIAEEKESGIKKRILEIRWKRVIHEAKRSIASFLKPIFSGIFKSISHIYQKALDLEKFYKEQKREKKEEKIDSGTRLENYLLKGKSLEQDGLYKEAEEAYIKALEIDDRNIAAYRGLANVYKSAKDYTKARETLLFLIQLIISQKPESETGQGSLIAESYAELASIEEHLGNYQESLSYIRKALSFDANNPRFLDLLLHFSIIVKDKKLALRTLKQLKAVNPDNQKIPEFEEEINKI